MYQIVSKEQDMAGRWMVRAVITSERTAFFSFDHDPTQAEVDAVADKYVNRPQPEPEEEA